MKTKYKKFILALTFVTFAIPCSFAQKTDVQAKIIDKNGQPLPRANIAIVNTPISTLSNGVGSFVLQTDVRDSLIVTLKGYDKKIVSQSDIQNNQIVLSRSILKKSEQDIRNLPNRMLYTNEMVGASSKLQGEDLKGKIDVNATSALKGMVAGLYISEKPGAHRESSYDIAIRGLNTQVVGNAAPLIIIDGVERSLEYLVPEDIESIEVLKDAVAKTFYRGRAANGVILIKTKRGSKYKETRSITIETGMSKAKLLPKFMNSAEYAEHYNIARKNSGLSDFYSAADIAAYQNPSLRHPSNDYYDLLLKNSKSYTRASAIFSGGSDKVQYHIGGSYLHNGGLEGVGRNNSMDQFSIRSNLNFQVSSMVDAYLDLYAFVDDNETNYLQANTLFSRMSTQRPNEYTVLLDGSQKSDTVAYGASRYSTDAKYQNLYGEMAQGGIRENTQKLAQTKLGFNFNLADLLAGLSANVSLAFDTYDFVSVGKKENFYSYIPIWDNNNKLVGKQTATVGEKKSNKSTLDKAGYRRLSLEGMLKYKKEFGDHKVNSGLVYQRDEKEDMYINFVNKSQSGTMLLHYSFQDKWIAEFNAGLIGSSKLASNHRYKFFPAGGIGWVVSNEPFMESIKNSLNYLKLKTSYGISGNDDALNYFAYQTRWNYANKNYYTYFGTDATKIANTTQIDTYANPSIDWETSTEFNVGIEAVIANDFSLNFDYYHYKRKNIPIYAADMFTQVWGIDNKQINHLEINNNGLELTVQYDKIVNDWRFRASANGNYSLSKYAKSPSWQALPGYRNLNNRSVDAYIGLVSQGLITTPEQLSQVKQQFGEVGQGDLQYADINGDGVVNEKDVTQIGNSFPRFQFGFQFAVEYKGFDLGISAYGAAKYDVYKSNAYYRPTPETAYSILARDAYNPATGQGNRPRLTTTNSANNNQLSDFWLESGNYLKIKDIELGYTLPQKISQKARLNKLRFFVKGNNLLTLTGLDDLDPEYLDAGITSYPFMRTFTAGLNVTF